MFEDPLQAEEAAHLQCGRTFVMDGQHRTVALTHILSSDLLFRSGGSLFLSCLPMRQLPKRLFMNAFELVTLCDSFNPDDDGKFKEIVAAGLEILGTYQRDIAAEFDVAVSTVSRWAAGIACPHPLIQKVVVASIRARAQKASGTGRSRTQHTPAPMAAKSRKS